MKPNGVIRQYLRDVKRVLPCNYRQKKCYLSGIENSLYPYLIEHPDATLNDLYSVFGTPASIVEDYLNNTDAVQISRKISIKRRILIGAISAVTVLVIVLCSIAIVDTNRRDSFYNGFFVETFGELPDDAEADPKLVEKH